MLLNHYCCHLHRTLSTPPCYLYQQYTPLYTCMIVAPPVNPTVKKKKASAKDAAAKGSKGSNSKGSKGSPPASAAAAPHAAVEDPPLTALCNATGALHHLSFLDDAKRDIAAAGGAETLVKLLKCSHAQTYDNVVGALWNLALLPDNQPLLKEAKAPAFLTRPVPAR